MQTQVDVHVHSKYSDRPSEWLLRRVGAPESFTEPLDIYHRARQRGMKFVTISDHNRIDGALEIAHLAGTFISNEVTTYFPENGAKVHCLVLGITPEQFDEIQRLRENIYEFQQYVVDQDIVYSVAHPLFRVNEHLTVDQLERLLLMFQRFELLNGTRRARAAELFQAIAAHLTPKMMEEMADRQGLAPLGAEPWRKSFTGGSDDHSGIYIASAFTVTPPAETVPEFLDHLRAGRHRPGGVSGDSLRLAHSFYHIAYGYYKNRLLTDGSNKNRLLSELFRKLLERPEAAPKTSFGGKLLGWGGNLSWLASRQTLGETERQLVDEFQELFRTRPAASEPLPPDSADDRHTFQLACHISQQLGFSFFQKFMEHIQAGSLLESLQTLSSLGPVALSIAPYLASFGTQHKDELFHQKVAARFPTANRLQRRSEKKAWVTDTFNDVNGVTRTIGAMRQAARRQGRELTVLTCLAETPPASDDLCNFQPVGEFKLPEYETQTLSFPPFLEVIEYLERQQFSEVIISTPGPLGLTALAAARLLKMRVSGIYHTDFPAYIHAITDDELLTRLTWRYMQWFFGQMDTLFVPSQCYLKRLAENGFRPEKMRVLRRGVDTALFHPSRRDENYWNQRGVGPGLKFLYVGRLSPEKGLEPLLEGFERLLQQGQSAQLILVGDGPQRDALSQRFYQPEITFTGFLSGAELATAYASADAFVFPSRTDTFGNVVLEAQASGLPMLVTAEGGPAETVQAEQSGWLVEGNDATAWEKALLRVCQSSAEFRTLGQRAAAHAHHHSWDSVFADFWRTPTELPLDHALPHPLESLASLVF